MFMESLTYGIQQHSLHSALTYGNTYRNIACGGNDAPVFACAYLNSVGVDAGSKWSNISVGAGTAHLIDLNPAGGVIRLTVAEPDVVEYDREGNTIFSMSHQIASANLMLGDSFPNQSVWPSFFLPGKTIDNGGVQETAFMTVTDVSNGVAPYGIATNGQLGVGAGPPAKSATLVTKGPAACIFDGPTTDNDWVVPSVGTVIGTAVGCHDTGSTIQPASGYVVGTVKLATSAAPSTPAAPTVTTNCTGTCATTYTYCVVQRANANDQTQSACSSSTSVSSAAILSNVTTNTIGGSAFSGCTSVAPCDLYKTANNGLPTGFIVQIKSTSNFVDDGYWGDSSVPFSTGIIAPLINVGIVSTSNIPTGSNTVKGILQCDGVSVFCTSGSASTTAGVPIAPYAPYSRNLNAGIVSTTANSQYAYWVQLPNVKFSHMCILVDAPDTTGLYSMAIVSAVTTGAATIVANSTAAAHLTAPSGPNWNCFAVSGAPVTLAAGGNYFLVLTGNATVATFGYDSQASPSPLTVPGAGTSSSGVISAVSLTFGTGPTTATVALPNFYLY